jgi:hypothetical protein
MARRIFPLLTWMQAITGEKSRRHPQKTFLERKIYFEYKNILTLTLEIKNVGETN